MIGVPALLIAIYYLMGQIGWQLIGTQGEAPFNAYWQIWSYPNEAIHQKALMLLGIPAFIFIVTPILAIAAYFKNKKRWIHGKARLATARDIRNSGLNKNKGGIFLGYFNGKPLYENGDEHIQLVAPTRTGKGVSVIIPILLTYDQSMIIHDAKKELWDITAAYRKRCGHQVFKFSPFSKETHRFNPLSYINEESPLDHLQLLSYLVWPNPEKGDPIWNASARSLFQGLALYILETEGQESLTFANILSLSQTANLTDFLEKEVLRHSLSDTCEKLLTDFSDTTEKTRSGILKSFTSALDIFQNPLIAAATSANDFDLRELRKQKQSIYIATGLDNITRMGFLNRILFQLATLENLKTSPEDDPSLIHKVLLLPDEMASMGKMEQLAESIAFIAGYNIRLLSVWQSEAQIHHIYGQHGAKAFIDNHKTKIFFNPELGEATTALCKKIGYTTIKNQNMSISKGNKSKNYSLQQRLLLLPEDLNKKLGEKRALLFTRGLPPLIMNKIRYFDKVQLMSRIVPEENLKKALKSKTMVELKPYLYAPPVVPEAMDYSKNIAKLAKQSTVDNIKPPKDDSDKEIENYVDQHISSIF